MVYKTETINVIAFVKKLKGGENGKTYNNCCNNRGGIT
jgi:hypothetical protein